jgi:hypothetical protein
VTCSERRKEIKRRRHRKKKIAHLAKRAAQSNVSEKGAIATKIRHLTLGADAVIERLELEER